MATIRTASDIKKVGSPLLMTCHGSGTGKTVISNSNSNVISRDGGEEDNSIDDKNMITTTTAVIPENINTTPPAEPEPDMIYDDYMLELLKRKRDLDARERRVHELELEYRDVIKMAKQLVDLGVEADQIIILQEAVMYVSEIEQIDTTEAAQKIFGMLKRTIELFQRYA